MTTEGLKKIRKGLVLLIEGSIEDTKYIFENSPIEERMVRDALRYRIKQIGNYFRDAETYSMDKIKIKDLKEEYNIQKRHIDKCLEKY